MDEGPSFPSNFRRVWVLLKKDVWWAESWAELLHLCCCLHSTHTMPVHDAKCIHVLKCILHQALLPRPSLLGICILVPSLRAAVYLAGETTPSASLASGILPMSGPGQGRWVATCSLQIWELVQNHTLPFFIRACWTQGMVRAILYNFNDGMSLSGRILSSYFRSSCYLGLTPLSVTQGAMLLALHWVLAIRVCYWVEAVQCAGETTATDNWASEVQQTWELSRGRWVSP